MNDWPKIKQVVVEVGPKNKPELKNLIQKLTTLGFRNVTTEKSFDGGAMIEEDPVHCILYATH